MNVKLSPKVQKYLLRLDAESKERLKKAFIKLSHKPPQGDITSLSGRDGYRLRVGKYRALFDIIDSSIIVYDIDVRGQIYKKGR